MGVTAIEEGAAAPATEQSPTPPPDAGAPADAGPQAQAPEEKAEAKAEALPEEPGTEQPAEEEAAAKEEGAEEEAAKPFEFTEDLRESLVEGYGDELWESPKLQERVQRQVQAEVQRQVREQTQARQAEIESQAFVQQGQAAVEGMAGLLAQAKTAFEGALETARTELGKAQKGEDFKGTIDANWSLNEDAVLGFMQNYGAAIVADIENQTNRAFLGALNPVFEQFTDEEGQQLQTIVATANRIKNDPNQQGKATPYLMANVLKVVWDRALAVGAANERNRAEKQRGVADRLANTNAVTAARAKLAAERTPPVVPGGEPGTPQGGDLEEQFMEAHRTGNKPEAERLLSLIGQRGTRGG